MQLYNHTNMKVSISSDNIIYDVNHEAQEFILGLDYIEVCLSCFFRSTLWQSQYGYLVGMKTLDPTGWDRTDGCISAILTSGEGVITYVPLFQYNGAAELRFLTSSRQFCAARNRLYRALKLEKGSS